MKIKSAQFLKSAPTLADCIETNLPEFALIGRSNVGKSSFINTISNNNKLAKTSNKPGKTQLINLYKFNDEFFMADFPWYGFANVSYNLQNIWQKNLSQYLLERKNLELLVQFIDSRHPLQKNDKLMNDWIKYNSLKSVVVLTKIDLISKNDINSKIKYYENNLESKVFLFSNKFKRFNDLILTEFDKYIVQ